MTRVLICGCGWIGQQFFKYLKNGSTSVAFSKNRGEDAVKIREELGEGKYTHLICALGRTHGGNVNTIDYLEKPGKLKINLRDNLLAPVTLALVTSELGVHMSYIGTGCIFEGADEFSEDAKPNFTGSAYSTVKGQTDVLFHLPAFQHVLNARIRMPITAEPSPRNFITKITTYERVINIPNSMTVLPDFIPILVRMMFEGVTGTFNCTNPGSISHNELLDMYKKEVNSDFSYKNFSLEEQSRILACGRSNNTLDSRKLQSVLRGFKNPSIILPDIKTSVRKMLRIYKENYENRRVICITGGYGFIGSACVNILYAKYPSARIVNLDKMTYCANESNVNAKIRSDRVRYKHYKLDLCDYEKVFQVLRQEHVNVILHFAAESHVDKSFDNPMDFTLANIVGTQHLLQATLKLGSQIKRFVHMSTDEVYGSNHSLTHEDSLLHPTNPYSASKAAAEMYIHSYIQSFNVPCIICRCNNVFGPNQFPEKVIPKFILRGLRGERLQIQGSGQARRSFIHVTDVIDAIDKITEDGKLHEVYNIGTKEEICVLDLARLVLKKLGRSSEALEFIPDRPFNDQRYFIDSTKLEAIGWERKVNFEDGLTSLIAIYKAQAMSSGSVQVA